MSDDAGFLMAYLNLRPLTIVKGSVFLRQNRKMPENGEATCTLATKNLAAMTKFFADLKTLAKAFENCKQLLATRYSDKIEIFNLFHRKFSLIFQRELFKVKKFNFILFNLFISAPKQKYCFESSFELNMEGTVDKNFNKLHQSFIKCIEKN